MDSRGVKIEDLFEIHMLGELYLCEFTNNLFVVDNLADNEENSYLCRLMLRKEGQRDWQEIYKGRGIKILASSENMLIISEQIEADDKKISVISELALSYPHARRIRREFAQKPELIKSGEGFLAYTVSEKLTCLDVKGLIEFDELPFFENGKGLVDKTRTALYIEKEDGGSVKISSVNEKVSHIAVNKSCKLLAYISREYEGKDPVCSSLFIWDMESGEKSEILSQKKGYLLADPVFLDNDTLFCTAYEGKFPGENPVVLIYDISKGELKELRTTDLEFNSAMVMDLAYGKPVRQFSDEGKLIFSSTVGTSDDIYSFTKDGVLECLCHTEKALIDFVKHEDMLYFTAVSDKDLHEVYALNLENGKTDKLSNFNGGYLSERKIFSPESFIFTNRDGVDMEVFVILPSHDEGDRLPCILQVHGGPKAVYGNMINHEFQVLAAEGIASVFTNPRGSDGRGSDYANIVGELGYMDYNDLMEALDEALKRYPVLDKNRLGLSGGSYGGLIANYACGKTNRFKAICSQRGISGYISKPFTTDIGYYHNIKQLKATPWEDFDKVAMHSPLTDSEHFMTPMLFIHSDEDYRCWQVEGISMYNALKRNGVDARFAFFYGENHNLSRTGKPHNRVVRLREIRDWFKSGL